MPNYTIDLQALRSGFDGEKFWAQARIGAIPRKGQPPILVITAQPSLRSGSDVYYALSEWRSEDGGVTWSEPIEHTDTLGRRDEGNDLIAGICDMTPRWHAASRKLLLTGHTVRYRNDKEPLPARTRETAYSVYDLNARSWTPWQMLAMPDRPDFINAGIGSGERFDLEDGTILLPVYYKKISDDWHAVMSVTVTRCAFDGETLTYLEHGTEMSVPEPRGLGEPSVTRYKGRFYLTLRNDVRGYVAVSDDGLHYADPIPWRFDDGEELGSYNTQQHWASQRDGLYLVYTRRGLDNDHVFRNRAPLMIAQVDPERLVVLRDTEREVVPNRGAGLGNFSVCTVSPDEAWIVVAEIMQPVGCERYGSDNTIWAAKLTWE